MTDTTAHIDDHLTFETQRQCLVGDCPRSGNAHRNSLSLSWRGDRPVETGRGFY